MQLVMTGVCHKTSSYGHNATMTRHYFYQVHVFPVTLNFDPDSVNQDLQSYNFGAMIIIMLISLS